MYDKSLCRHEAAHALVSATLGLRAVAVVREDSGELKNLDPDLRLWSDLEPESLAILAVSGHVAEALAIDGNLKRAVSDTLATEGGDGDLLRHALSQIPAWRYRDGRALAAAGEARRILVENRQEFDRLTATLERDGIARVDMGPRPAAKVDYSTNLRGVVAGDKSKLDGRGGRVQSPESSKGQAVGLAELRSLASKAASDGNATLASLMAQTVARAEGRSVEPLVEFSIGTIDGSAKAILKKGEK